LKETFRNQIARTLEISDKTAKGTYRNTVTLKIDFLPATLPVANFVRKSEKN